MFDTFFRVLMHLLLTLQEQRDIITLMIQLFQGGIVMTYDEKVKAMERLRVVETLIHEVEARTNKKILLGSSMCINDAENTVTVSFTGENDIYYEIPYHIFKTIPPKRVVIEVSRAITIDYNDYGMEG